MAIEESNFNKVVVGISSNVPFPAAIVAYQDDTLIGYVPFLDGRTGHFDTSETTYEYVRDRIYDDDATHEYNIDGTHYASESDVPDFLEFNLDKDPLQASLIALATVPR